MNNNYLLQNSFVDYSYITDQTLLGSNFNNPAYSYDRKNDLEPTIIVDYSAIAYSIKIEGVNISHESISERVMIPISILSGNSALEAIVVYLKDVSQLRLSHIAKILGRDQRTIWVTYSHAKKKNLQTDISESRYFIPANIFASRNFSILESIVFYLKNNHTLTINQISGLLGKNYQTIRTVYRRALTKLSAKI